MLLGLEEESAKFGHNLTDIWQDVIKCGKCDKILQMSSNDMKDSNVIKCQQMWQKIGTDSRERAF